ncbi:hypothetical protein ACJ2A9_01435 [Anaerobacillus sp. MEB173]|uniref:hypothetical protein n=1 Tax=Anaerobacillus sp. MEB173 TaxID=3383345 RepID=UPI003F8FC6E9
MNMNLLLIMILIVNGLIGSLIYNLMYKKRKLFTDRYGMVMTMCSSGVLSVNLAMLIHFLLPANLVLITFIATVIGGTIGILFGSLVKFQSLLAGFFYGAIGGIMGTMFGAVIENPALCGLPASYLNSVDQNMIIFSLFGTALVSTSIGLLYYSLRV